MSNEPILDELNNEIRYCPDCGWKITRTAFYRYKYDFVCPGCKCWISRYHIKKIEEIKKP